MDMEKFKDRWTVFAKRVAFMEQHNLKYFTYDSFFITCLLELKKKEWCAYFSDKIICKTAKENGFYV